MSMLSFEKSFTIMARNIDGRGTTIPVTMTAFYSCISGCSDIAFNLPDESFALLCKYMRHGKPNAKLSTAVYRHNVNSNLKLEREYKLHALTGDGAGVFVGRFVPRNCRSQFDCAEAGGEMLVRLFALADVRGLTSWQRAASYMRNLEDCPFNAAMRELFATVLANAVIYCCQQHPLFEDRLNALEGSYMDKCFNPISVRGVA